MALYACINIPLNLTPHVLQHVLSRQGCLSSAPGITSPLAQCCSTTVSIKNHVAVWCTLHHLLPTGHPSSVQSTLGRGSPRGTPSGDVLEFATAPDSGLSARYCRMEPAYSSVKTVGGGSIPRT